MKYKPYVHNLIASDSDLTPARLIRNFKSSEQISPNMKFDAAFDEALLAKLSPNERKIYAASLRNSRDLRNVIVTAVDKGIASGEVSGSYKKACEIANKGFQRGLTNEDISELTELPIDRIVKLRAKFDRQ